MTDTKRRRGRPATGRATVKNVTIDPDALVLLQTAQEMMEQELGFRPTLGQTVKRLAAVYAATTTTKQENK
jgi:thiamine biosynthesis lipoprotein ApbE